MKQRTITALIMIAVILGIIFFIPILFIPLVAVVLGISVWEWCKISKITGRNRYIVAIVTLVLWLLALYNATILNILLVLSVCHYLYAVFLIINYEKKADYRITSLYLTALGPILLSALAAVLIYINPPFDPESIDFWTADDARILTFIVMVIAAADTGAYFAGRFLGRHQLSPRVSPKKTVEGLIGGLVAVVAVVLLFGSMLESWYLSTGQLLTISLTAALFSVIGDLFISVIKRQNHIKDSSNILPGHGGVLDRIDGLLAGIPVFYLLVQFIY